MLVVMSDGDGKAGTGHPTEESAKWVLRRIECLV